MEIFNIIANSCSIVGLLVALFTASKVVRLSNSNNDNTGEIQQGDGMQKIAKDHSVLAEEHSNVKYTYYDNPQIYGEIDELPDLSDTYYPISAIEIDKYQLGIARNTSDLTIMNAANTLCFTVDFKNVTSKTDDNRWIGYSIKSLPMSDWRSFINMNYCLEFDYVAIGNVKEIWLEITNFKANKKICKRKLELSSLEKHFNLQLNCYKNVFNDWKSVDEICFVFFPEDCIGQQGSVFIINPSVRKG